MGTVLNPSIEHRRAARVPLCRDLTIQRDSNAKFGPEELTPCVSGPHGSMRSRKIVTRNSLFHSLNSRMVIDSRTTHNSKLTSKPNALNLAVGPTSTNLHSKEPHNDCAE